jgi:hypothetical protein
MRCWALVVEQDWLLNEWLCNGLWSPVAAFRSNSMSLQPASRCRRSSRRVQQPAMPPEAALSPKCVSTVSSASYLLTENGLCRKGRPFPKTGSVERGREFHSAHPLLNDSKTAQNRTTVSNDRSGKTPFQGYYNAGQGRIGRGFLRVLGCEDRCDFSAPPRIPLAFRYKAWYNRHIGLRGAAIAP